MRRLISGLCYFRGPIALPMSATTALWEYFTVETAGAWILVGNAIDSSLAHLRSATRLTSRLFTLLTSCLIFITRKTFQFPLRLTRPKSDRIVKAYMMAFLSQS